MADRTTPNVQLPESAIHTILSYLPPADAIRASASSRQWRLAWISSPFLSFDEKPCPFKNADFFDYVDRSIALLRHRCDRSLNLETLSLSAAIDNADSASRLHPIISFAESRRVKAIELLNDADEFWLNLHTDTLWPLLFACESLDALLLRCFAIYFPSPLAISASAKKLVFKFNFIDDVSLRCFLSCFPSLEHLALEHCLGLHEIRISSSSLQTLELFLGDDTAERVVIDAASLRSLSYERSLRAAGIVRLFNCRSLTSLTIVGIRFDPESGTNPVQDYVSQIPVLEDLTLDDCEFSGVIQISHWNLRRLSMERNFGDMKVEIWTPNLRFFKYFGFVFDFLAFRYDYGFLEAKLGLCTCSLGDTEWFWFVKLRNFLEIFNKCYSLTLDCFVEVVLNCKTWFFHLLAVFVCLESDLSFGVWFCHLGVS